MNKNKDLSYAIHTGNEAKLMLEGSKPLSVFCKHVDVDICLDGLTEGQNFEDDSIGFEEWRFCDLIFFFYFLKSEHWRVNAYKVLTETIGEAGHSRQLEWIEGRLLGYTVEQNREFLEKKVDPWIESQIPFSLVTS